MPDCWLELTRMGAIQLEDDCEQVVLLSPGQANNSVIEIMFPELQASISDGTA
ncbi:MAG: hypothetical protein VKK42_01710 [Lyngbya sp.]|nr:hypothetical protein [Lyngbya sp.]